MADRCKMDTSPISEKVRQIAEKELRETPELVKESVAKLRELIKADGKIKINADDDNLMIIFLRPCKFYPESALELIKRTLKFKEDNGSLLNGLQPETEKEAMLTSDVVNVLVDRDQNGRRVLINKCGATWDPKKVNTDQIFRIFYLVHLAAMLEPESQVAGVVVILDFEGLGMKQVSGFSPTFSMRLLNFIQDAMPLRLKEVHIVKQPFLFNMVWTMFKPLVRAKLKGRLFFHGDKMSSLHKHMDPNHLPADYGGKLPKINYTAADWFPEIEKCRKHIADWDSFKLEK